MTRAEAEGISEGFRELCVLSCHVYSTRCQASGELVCVQGEATGHPSNELIAHVPIAIVKVAVQISWLKHQLNFLDSAFATGCSNNIFWINNIGSSYMVE